MLSQTDNKHLQVAHAVKNITFGFGTHPSYPEDYKMVAILEIPEDWNGEDQNYLAGYAFQATNHIDREWWNNEGVTCIGPKEHRSTSAGDVVVLPDGRVMRYELSGYSVVTVEEKRAS